MTTNELTKIWAKISGLFARKTEVATKADKAVVVTLSPDVNQQIVADKTFDEVFALLQGGTEVMFNNNNGFYFKVVVFMDAAILASVTDQAITSSIYWSKTAGITITETQLQQLLTFDNEPRKASTNPVTSAGLHEALQSKADTSTTYTKTEVNTALQGKQDVLTFDNVPTQSSNNPVKSGGVYDAFSTYCPIIEDTRSSAVAAITGVAPFASLVDGQRIVLHFAYRSANSSTLTLTLSGGDTTATIPIYKQSYNNVSQLGYNFVREGTFYTLIYCATDNRWWIVGCIDTNTAYGTISQGEIDAGTQIVSRVVTPKILCDNFDKVTTLVEVTATGDVTQSLDSGKFYRFGEVDSLTLTFTAPSAGMGMWGGKFTASANWSALGIPATIDEAAGNDTIAGGKTYEFNVLDGIIVVKEV